MLLHVKNNKYNKIKVVIFVRSENLNQFSNLKINENRFNNNNNIVNKF